jgi:hypothetical protein
MGGHDLMGTANARIGAVSAGITVRVARIGAVVSRRIGRTACTGRRHHAGASELTRSSRRSHVRAAMVHAGKLCAVIVRYHLVLPL